MAYTGRYRAMRDVFIVKIYSAGRVFLGYRILDCNTAERITGDRAIANSHYATRWEAYLDAIEANCNIVAMAD